MALTMMRSSRTTRSPTDLRGFLRTTQQPLDNALANGLEGLPPYNTAAVGQRARPRAHARATETREATTPVGFLRRLTLTTSEAAAEVAKEREKAEAAAAKKRSKDAKAE